MNLDFNVDDRFWLFVPAEFPAREFTTIDEWREAAVHRYAETKPAADEAELDSVRELLLRAHTSVVQSGVEFGLQFWPTSAPVTLLFHVVALSGHVTDELPAVFFDGINLAAPPTVEEVPVEGARRAYLLSFLAAVSPEATRAELAGLGAIVEFDAGTVLMRSEATVSTMVGLAAPHLSEVIQAFSVSKSANSAP